MAKMKITISKPSNEYEFRRMPNDSVHVARAVPKIGRNDPCPCGSGKKYKLCHFPIQEGR
jgi:preprotein translocase subunit SecA